MRPCAVNIGERGHCTMGQLRDALSANQLKVDEAFPLGDQLLLLDRHLAVALDTARDFVEGGARRTRFVNDILLATRRLEYPRRFSATHHHEMHQDDYQANRVVR